ncbi:MAG: pentapeptide repeat-containing protein [Cyanobacteria bacterium J06639_18]
MYKNIGTAVYLTQMPQDYSGKNLQGCSFKGKNLEGANFSYADIRGANFTNAILRGSDFRGAEAGQERSWMLFLTVFLSFIALLPAFTAGITTIFNQSLLNPNPLVHLSTVVILILPFIVTTTKGFPASLVSIAFSLGISTLLVIFSTFSTLFSDGTTLAFIFIAIGTITGSTSIAASITGVTILAGIRVAIMAGITSVIASLAGTVVGMFFLEKFGSVSNFELAAELAVAIG